MLAIYILTLLAFIFVSWLLWDRHYGTKRFIKKLEAQEKLKKSKKHAGASKKNRRKEKNVVVGPATALAGAALIHQLRKQNHHDNDVDTPSDDIADLYDDMDDLYMMDQDEEMDYYNGVQSDDDAAYDDYMASLDDEY